ncbi:MAG: glycosyltransferase [Bacteroidota bacterium]
MQEIKKHVVQVGSSGFPFGMAAIEKIRLIGLGLVAAGMDVTVINRKGTFAEDSGIDIPPKGNHEGVDYVFCSNSIYRPNSFIKRNLRKVLGLWNEFWLLVRFKREKRLDYAIIHNREYHTVMYYIFLSRMLGFKAVWNFVELGSVLPERDNPKTRALDKKMEHVGIKKMDGILPISEVLCKFLDEHAPEVPYFKLPMVCDFSKFTPLKVSPDRENFFLYCGSMAYYEVIAFILEAFDRLDPPEDWYLYMVLGGNKEYRPKVDAKIAELRLQDRVKIFSWIPYEELIQKYKDARALLIPLRDTEQDRARFPHKIGEYMASSNPIITTNVGEVEHYFVDMDTALIAETYALDLYIEKMRYILENPEDSMQIGLKGNQFGLDTFDCIAFGKMLANFFLSLTGELEEKEAVVY